MNPLASIRGPRLCLRHRIGAFSLVEVVLAIGIVSFGLLAVVGLIPLGLGAMKSAVNDTATSLILQDLRERLAAQPFTTQVQGPFFYNAEGAYIGTNNTAPDNIYRVDVTVAAPDPANLPAFTNLLVAKANIGWPVSAAGISPEGRANRMTYSFFVTPSSGPSWDSNLGGNDPTLRKMDL